MFLQAAELNESSTIREGPSGPYSLVEQKSMTRLLSTGTFNLRSRIKAAAIHLSVSASLASLVAFLVLAVWYPYPYNKLSGGYELFFLVTSVDFVLGPILTFVAFDLSKSRLHLIGDISVIAALQISALTYGLQTVYGARPVCLIFEVDRFRVISANEVAVEELKDASPRYSHLAMWGPKLLGCRPPASNEEKIRSIDMALQGVDIGQRPIFWQPYALSRRQAIAKSRPITVLEKRYPTERPLIKSALQKIQVTESSALFLPVTSRRSTSWVTILNAQGIPAAFLPLNGFF